MISKNMLFTQLRRGLLSIRFAIVVVLSLFLVGFQWWTMRHTGYRIQWHEPTFLDEVLLFAPDGSGTTLYLFLFPFLAALVGGSVLAVERRSGRLLLLQARSSYGVVERTSLCSGFLLGSLGGVLPYVMSLVFSAVRNPHLTFIDGVESSDMEIRSFQYILVSSESWIYPIYRLNQPLCIVVLGLLVAVISGLFTCIAVAVSPFVKRGHVEVLVPVAFMLLWWMLPVYVPHLPYTEDANPILYLDVDSSRPWEAKTANLIGIAITLVGLPAITAVLCWLQRRFHDR